MGTQNVLIDPVLTEYASPVNENGEWEPHWVFVGEIMNALDKQ